MQPISQYPANPRLPVSVLFGDVGNGKGKDFDGVPIVATGTTDRGATPGKPSVWTSRDHWADHDSARVQLAANRTGPFCDPRQAIVLFCAVIPWFGTQVGLDAKLVTQCQAEGPFPRWHRDVAA